MISLLAIFHSRYNVTSTWVKDLIMAKQMQQWKGGIHHELKNNVLYLVPVPEFRKRNVALKLLEVEICESRRKIIFQDYIWSKWVFNVDYHLHE